MKLFGLSDLFVKHRMPDCWSRCDSVPSDKFKRREYLFVLKNELCVQHKGKKIEIGIYIDHVVKQEIHENSVHSHRCRFPQP